MKYSNFSREQIVTPLYEQVAKKLLTLVKDKDNKNKMERDIV